MRKLLTNDLFKFTRLIKSIGLKDEIKRFASDVDKQQDVAAVGVDFLMIILERISDEGTEKLLYEFLSGPFEMEADEIANMELIDMVEALAQIADVEKWRSFLKIATR